MPIHKIKQPEILQINDSLRLRAFNEDFHFALEWYQDRQLVDMVDGKEASLYDMNKLSLMYHYLNNHGECYFIEILEDGHYIPVGDVTFSMDDCPIVIAPSYQNRHIGSQVIQAWIQRARALHFDTIYVREIYDYNQASQALFTKAGFVAYKKTEHGSSYLLKLQ